MFDQQCLIVWPNIRRFRLVGLWDDKVFGEFHQVFILLVLLLLSELKYQELSVTISLSVPYLIIKIKRGLRF